MTKFPGFDVITLGYIQPNLKMQTEKRLCNSVLPLQNTKKVKLLLTDNVIYTHTWLIEFCVTKISQHPFYNLRFGWEKKFLAWENLFLAWFYFKPEKSFYCDKFSSVGKACSTHSSYMHQ